MGEPEAKYHVEVAKSGRSYCEASKERIEQGELRFGTLASVMGHAAYQWRKPEHLTFRIARNVQAKVGNAENVDGFGVLSAGQQAEFREAFAAALAGPGLAKAQSQGENCRTSSVF